MTAIVTGQKTLNGVISQSPVGAIRGKKDGAELKTLLEYAEQKGLSTGIITDDDVTGATPATCYSHVNSRDRRQEIAEQFVNPKFGDGPELLIGRDQGYFSPKEQGGKRADSRDIADEARKRGYQSFSSADDFLSAAHSPTAKVLGLFKGPLEVEPVVEKAISILSRNPRGYFLMVERDTHLKTAKQSLENTLELDRVVARVRKLTDPSKTLLVVTADHSYDLRFPRGGKRGEDILPAISIDGHHTAEEVLLAADGPGASQVHGFMKNTDVFELIKSAFGW
jgi:alkaline phosphatase